VSRVVQRYVLPDCSILKDTDLDQTVGEYAFDPTVSERVVRRRNRREIAQTFAFDAVGKLTTVRVPSTRASPRRVARAGEHELRHRAAASRQRGHCDERTAPGNGRGRRDDVPARPVRRAPKVIRDALGNSTRRFRRNRAFPVTRYAPGARERLVNDAFHDAKGLITKLVQYAPLGPEQDAVTEYTWDPKWERVTGVTFPEGNVLQFAYDTAKRKSTLAAGRTRRLEPS
jgi:YD repeat-containing protein